MLRVTWDTYELQGVGNAKVHRCLSSLLGYLCSENQNNKFDYRQFYSSSCNLVLKNYSA